MFFFQEEIKKITGRDGEKTKAKPKRSQLARVKQQTFKAAKAEVSSRVVTAMDILSHIPELGLTLRLTALVAEPKACISFHEMVLKAAGSDIYLGTNEPALYPNR